MSTHVPVDVELPAVIDTAQSLLLRCARKTGWRRDAGSVCYDPDLPDVSRNAISFSPSSSSRTGSESGVGNSDDSSPGSQYSRMRLPMAVPGPTRVSNALSLALSMHAS